MLVDEISLSPRNYFELTGAVSNYLSSCMEMFGVTDPMRLPNRTPNGILMPKMDLLPQFNQVEDALVRAFDSLGIDAQYVQWPLKIRVRNTETDAEKSRPFATSKTHTDIWVGDPVNCKTVIMPLMGPGCAGCLEFGEPKEGTYDPKLYEREYSSYEEGLSHISHIHWYDIIPQAGKAYIVDARCLHKSRASGLRVSIDFRFSKHKPLPSRLADAFIPYTEWRHKRMDVAETVNQAMSSYK